MTSRKMKTIEKIKIAFLALWTMFFASACPQPEGTGSPFEMYPEIPYKSVINKDIFIEGICYIDVEKYNPLNAKDYIFTAGADTPETQFFNYVVLGFSWLVKDAQGYTHLEMTPALEYILSNSTTYLRPLQEKGIRVLIEVRSGNFSDTESGTGTGFGTLDMAAINELTKDLKLIVNQYGIDGFDFNDIGGGQTAYPPLTRQLKQFQMDIPLYPDALFKDNNDVPLSDEKIEEVLWTEGGSNFSNLIQRTNEALKETYTYQIGDGNDTTEVVRVILVRNRNHGQYLLSQLRMAYMPDAYSGADPKVIGNLRYIINDEPYEYTNPRLHAFLWTESPQKTNIGEEADYKYAPFAVDLMDQKDADTARRWAKTFLLKDPDGSATEPENQNRYGALYFTNLPPVSEADSAAYMTYFSRELFGRVVRLADRPAAGDYKKTW